MNMLHSAPSVRVWWSSVLCLCHICPFTIHPSILYSCLTWHTSFSSGACSGLSLHSSTLQCWVLLWHAQSRPNPKRKQLFVQPAVDTERPRGHRSDHRLLDQCSKGRAKHTNCTDEPAHSIQICCIFYTDKFFVNSIFTEMFEICPSKYHLST